MQFAGLQETQVPLKTVNPAIQDVQVFDEVQRVQFKSLHKTQTPWYAVYPVTQVEQLSEI